MEKDTIDKLGRRIRDIRLNKGVSLRDLAKHIGLTRSFLSQVERGKSSPSIASLEKIATALNIELSHFFKDAFPPKFSVFRKKRERKFITKRAKVSSEVLVSDILDIAMVPLLFTLDIGGKIGQDQLWPYRKERFMITLKGKIELICGKEDRRKFVMEEGDSLYCKCDLCCNKMSNIGKQEAIMLWVVRAPIL